MVLRLFSSRAKGAWSLSHRKNRSRVASMIYSYANRYGVHVYQANHQHQEIVLLVKAKDRKALADFLRVLAGRVAVILTGAKKGVKKIGKFWNFLTWSKLVNWGKEFFVLARFIKNGLSHSQDLKLENKGESLLDWWDLATDPPR